MLQLTLTFDTWPELLIPPKKWGVGGAKWTYLRGWFGFLPAPHLEIWFEEFSQNRIVHLYNYLQEVQGTKLGLLSESCMVAVPKLTWLLLGLLTLQRHRSGLVACRSDWKRLLVFEPSQEATWEEQDLPFGCEEWDQAKWSFACCLMGRMVLLLLFFQLIPSSPLFLTSHFPHLKSADSSEEVLPSNLCL